ncbi:MAG: deoxyribose-phosphate aldolase [Flavobacteriaceae bacterium]|nr:deoxyribose-phosphate aldolase [Flavobacteriaceae bacterium]
MKYLIVFILAIFVTSCQEEKEGISADEIITKTIENAGGDIYKRSTVQFKFRGNTYKSIRNGGEFQLERIVSDSTGTFRDVVSNTGFQRFKNDSLIIVPDSMAVRYSGSVNSVHYFAHLPYGLNDKAVNKKLVGDAEINGEPYYQLKITFQQDGGGADHHDEFLYWIHKEKYTIDYLAYKFFENEGGIRFREANNPRIIQGIRFVDYNNYKINDFTTDLCNLDELFEEGKLELLSTIKTEDVEVEVKG